MRLKRKAKIFSVLIVVLAVVVFLGSIDQTSFDDKGLLAKISAVNDIDNGYNTIAYVYEPGFSLFENDE